MQSNYLMTDKDFLVFIQRIQLFVKYHQFQI